MPTIVWEEEDEDETTTEPVVSTKDEKQRDLVWLFGPPRKKEKRMFSRPEVKETRARPHPLRTDQWELQIRWRNIADNAHAAASQKQSSLLVDFADNGYLRATFDKSSKHFLVGSWEMMPSGLRCTLNSTLCFHADLHLNLFGRQPRLTRGVIVDTASTGWNDRRLVVGTFTGHGVGRDTADLTYKRRR